MRIHNQCQIGEARCQLRTFGVDDKSEPLADLSACGKVEGCQTKR